VSRFFERQWLKFNDQMCKRGRPGSEKAASAGFDWWVSEVNLQVDQGEADVAVRLFENVFNAAHGWFLISVELAEQAAVTICEVEVSLNDC